MTPPARLLCPLTVLLTIAVALPAWGAQPAGDKPDSGAANRSTGQHPLQGRVIKRIVVEGLVTLKPETVLRAMATRQGLPFNPSTYREDLKRIYELGYFEPYDVSTMKPLLEDGGVLIRIRLREKPIIDRVLIRGIGSSLSGRMLNELTTQGTSVKRGSRLSSHESHKVSQSMKEFLVGRRFPEAQIKVTTEPVKNNPGHFNAVFTVALNNRVDVTKVTFKGRKAFAYKVLLRKIRTRPSGFLRPAGKYVPDDVALDAQTLQDFYRSKGFADARVKVLPPNISAPMGRRKLRRAEAIFSIHEGIRYFCGTITFKGLKSVKLEKALEVTRKAFKQLPRSRPDSPLIYSDDGLRAASQYIRQMLGETGRPFARVIPSTSMTAKVNVLNLEMLVIEGPQAVIGDIRIKGNTRTQDRIIRREMELLPGDLFDSRKLKISESNLRRRQIFSRARAYPVPGDEPDTVDIEIEVEETRTGSIQFSGTVVPEDGSVGGGFSIIERNFDWLNTPRNRDELTSGGPWRGGAQNLSLNSSFTTTTNRISLDFKNPWIWDTPERYSFSTSGFYIDKDYDDFQDTRVGFSIQLGRILFIRRLRAYARYTLQSVKLHGLDEDLPPDILDEDQGRTLLSSGRIGLTFDGRNDWLLPTKGLLLNLSQDFYGEELGGDIDMRKTSFSGHIFVPLGRTFGYPHVIHLFGRADWANPTADNTRIPFYERFFAGGIGTVRGYDHRSLSPKFNDENIGGGFRTVQTAEYIFPLYRNTLRGVIFFDAGNVWHEEGDFEWHDQARAVGVGIQIQTPAAMGSMPIKFYFSEAINPDDDADEETFQMSFSLLF